MRTCAARRCGILQREFTCMAKRFERLAGISASHIYNLRRSAAYRKRRVRVQQRSAARCRSGSGAARSARQAGLPARGHRASGAAGRQGGRVSHQRVDTVTQWEVVGCWETISENHLIPVLEAMLHQFPFRILGFHCDNGSEYLNHTVVELLNKLLVEFTKSRACRTTDNALVEGKNGAVVRKHIGYGPIGSEQAEEIQNSTRRTSIPI